MRRCALTLAAELQVFQRQELGESISSDVAKLFQRSGRRTLCFDKPFGNMPAAFMIPAVRQISASFLYDQIQCGSACHSVPVRPD